MLNLLDENKKRFVAILNKKIESGRLMNALGHMTAGLASELGPEVTCMLQYEDADLGKHPNISHYPFIVLRAENSNKIRQVRKEVIAMEIPYSDFTSTMTIGTSEEQVNSTKKTKEEDLEYYGICMFGETDKLKEFTSKFSLFK